MSEKRSLTRLWIDGKSIDAKDGHTYSIINPYTETENARISEAGMPETTLAIDAAARAFKVWSGKTGNERANILYRGYFLLREQNKLLEQLVSEDLGKVQPEAIKEIRSTGAFLRFCAEEARRISGEILDSPEPSKRSLVIKQPVGVVAAITAANAPGVLFGRKVAPALAAGCTVVLKPAEDAFRATVLMAQLLEEAGLPPGTLNVIAGNAPEIVGALLDDPRIRLVSFTGSVVRGREILTKASRTLKRVVLELGGVSPFIVFEDADLDLAVKGLIQAKFRHGGQICASPQRVFLHDSIAEDFTEKLLNGLSTIKPGDPFAANSDYGPLQNHNILSRVQEIISDAINKNAELIYGNKLLGPLLLGPTVLRNINSDMTIAKEEVFGPVIGIELFSSEKDVISRANDTEYGLGAYLYTNDMSRSFRVSEALEVGTVGVNDPFPASIEGPFGGIKQSGIGLEGGSYGLEEFLYTKQISLRVSTQEN